MTPESSTFLLTQGVLGFTTLMLCIVVAFMWREIKGERARSDVRNDATVAKYEKQLADERAKAAIELAEERKAHALTQTTRISEMQQGWLTVQKVQDTLENTLAFVQRTAA